MEVIALNSKVKQVAPTIEGTISERRFNESASEMEYMVHWTDGKDGEEHHRWFLGSELEVTEAAKTPAAATTKKEG